MISKFLFVSVLLFSFSCGSAMNRANLNQRAPSFIAHDLDEVSFSFNTENIRKPTLLVFWASWCNACKEKTPMLVNLYKDINQQVEFIGISMDDDVANAAKSVTKQNIPYRNLIDTNNNISEKFRILGIPTIILLDTKGIIRFRGFTMDVNFHNTLENLIQQSRKKRRTKVN